MRAVLIGGILLLLLILAASVAWRRSRDAVARPASLSPAGAGVDARPVGPGEHSPPYERIEEDREGAEGDGGLILDPAEVDLGLVEARETREIEVRWSRTGPGALAIRAVESGCGCLVASGLPSRIPEGSSGVLAVEYRGRSHPGPFALGVHVVTDRPPGEVRRIRFRGFVGGLTVVSPGAIRLASVAPRTVTRRSATIRPPPGRARVRFSATLVGVAGWAEVAEPAERGAIGFDVECSIEAPAAAGPFSGSLVIEAGDESLWRIPITGTVVPPRSAAPSAAR